MHTSRFILWFRALFSESNQTNNGCGHLVLTKYSSAKSPPQKTETPGTGQGVSPGSLSMKTEPLTPTSPTTSAPPDRRTYPPRQSADNIEWASDTKTLTTMTRNGEFKTTMTLLEKELSIAVRRYEGLFEVLLRARQNGSSEEQLKAAADLESAQLKVDSARTSLDTFMEPALSKLDKMERLILMYKQIKHNISYEKQLEFIEAVRAYSESTKLTKNARELLLNSKGPMIEEQILKEIERFCETAERSWYATPLVSNGNRCCHKLSRTLSA